MNAGFNIMHVTHTDVRTDSRILKELNSLSSVNYSVSAVGMCSDMTEEKNVLFEDGSRARLILIKNSVYAVKFLPRPLRYFLAVVFSFFKVFFCIRRAQPYVIHCHDALMLPVCTVASVLLRTILIYDAHELESDKNGQTRSLKLFTYAIESICLRRVAGFITVSQSIENWYRTRFPWLTRDAAIIYNSPVQATNSDSTTGLREKLLVSDATKLFCYVGLLEKGRGLMQILEAFQKINSSDYHLVVFGYGPMQKDVEQASRQFQNISFLGRVDHDRLVQSISECDYGFCLIETVSLSDYYSLPNKLFEYASAGVPVIASNLPEIRHVVDIYGLGHIYEGEVDLPELICDIEVPRFEGIRSGSPLSWETQMVKLRELYQKVTKVT